MKKIILIILLSFLGVIGADASTGTIDTSATNTAKVCKDVSCTSPTPGSINFELSSTPAITIDSVTGISGYVWGNELGWILMNPTGVGVTFANSSTGLLTGKAWSQVSGWINFAPTGQSVTINPATGEFGGWAWTGGPYGGWIKFDCTDNSTCVRSTWRPMPPSSGGGSGGGMIIDVCPNIFDAQQSIPPGYTINVAGECVSVDIDKCPNILGEQPFVPSGYNINSIGACVFSDVDFCPNIKGKQSTIPSGHTISASGNCVIFQQEDLCPLIPGVQDSYELCVSQPKIDYCLNIPGNQGSVPVGYLKNNDRCFPELYDICKNIDGIQVSTPDNYTVAENGDCVFLPPDMCPNLAGYQNEIPRNFRQEGGVCIFQTPNNLNNKDTKIVAFPFIPKSLYIPTEDSFLKSVVRVVAPKKTTTPFKVDMVSAGVASIGGLGIFLGLFFLIRFLRKGPF